MGKASRAKRAGSRRNWERRQADRRDPLVQVQMYDELVGQAERGETLPCGCDAHQLLHGGGWHTFDELEA